MGKCFRTLCIDINCECIEYVSIPSDEHVILVGVLTKPFIGYSETLIISVTRQTRPKFADANYTKPECGIYVQFFRTNKDSLYGKDHTLCPRFNESISKFARPINLSIASNS